MVLDADTLKVLSELKHKRSVVKAALTRTLKFIGNFDPRVEAADHGHREHFLQRSLTIEEK